jgi:DNA repair protein SbcD/Mre11
MARLVALGDAHLGRTHLAHLRDDQGRNLREEDFLRSFAWAVDETIRLEPDGFVWLGDIFDHARPTYRTFAQVLGGLQRLHDAGLRGVAISGNHDTPRVRGTGSPYDALERVFANVTFAWRMEAVSAPLGDVTVHAVPQTLSTEEFRAQLEVASGRTGGDATDLLLAHVALTSLPTREWRDINELELEESAFDRRFDLVLLGHYHVFQKVSKRTWYAGSTDAFTFADRPSGAGPKGIVVLDTATGDVELVENPHERALVTVSVEAAGMGPGELVDAVHRAAAGTPEHAIVRVFLNHVDAAAFRQVGGEQFQEAVPGALHVQVEPDTGLTAFPVQGGPQIGSLEQEWSTYVERQDLAGLDRDDVVERGRRFLEAARGETV